MTLFVFQRGDQSRYTALNIAPEFDITKNRETDKTAICIGRVRKGLGFDITLISVSVPLTALSEFVDRIMLSGGQIRPLDLSAQGQEEMRDAFDSGLEAFDLFLEHYAPIS